MRRIRSFTLVPLFVALLAAAPVQADPSTSSSSSSCSWSGFFVQASLSAWQEILIMFGIIGTGEPTPPSDTDSGDGTVTSFGIIGTGEPGTSGG